MGSAIVGEFPSCSPSRGIVHQVNLEFLASVARARTTFGLLTRWLGPIHIRPWSMVSEF